MTAASSPPPSQTEPAADDGPAASKPKPSRFRRNFGATRPEPALVNRQMEVVTAAYRAFGSAEAARLFLNGANEQLGGRPIDIAGSSPEGFRQVIAALEAGGPTPAADGR